ncbi:F-box/LRR-repeat protein 20 [Microtus ochrogaster]|uniref:F-box/LRR-repeat protein 20 n=1 Tax=Microtus ochrogaster TaxID=79684 RepID=A0A8J6KKU3_MICOH|nr:F-box/LRR-repeat protein 20 [Microtus ochrogaster]
MRSGVAGRWGVFLFWVEVEALERTELATGSRRGRGRRGRWWRPRGTRAVCPPRPTGGPRVTVAAASRSRNSRACPGPCLCTPHAAAPCPGRTRWPHEEGRERSDQEQAWNVLALDGSNWQRIDLFDFQRDIEGRVVENISKRCGGFLRKLSLRGCLGVGDNALSTCTSLSKFCSKLRHLDLASCTSITNMSLKALSEGCPLLEQLNISWCDQVTKDGIQALVRGCGGLKALFLKGCTQQITDEGLITICRGCHKLQSLCASGCSNITDAILNALGQNCPRLRILEVARCSQLTDVGFTTLARNCHELEKMDLEECVQSLSHCELVTDDGIRHLGNGACAHDQLEVIELDNCPLITDASLEHLKSCHSLERIELYDCQQITRAGIKRLRTHLPNIKVHAYFAPVTPPPSVGGSRQRFCRARDDEYLVLSEELFTPAPLLPPTPCAPAAGPDLDIVQEPLLACFSPGLRQHSATPQAPHSSPVGTYQVPLAK